MIDQDRDIIKSMHNKSPSTVSSFAATKSNGLCFSQILFNFNLIFLFVLKNDDFTSAAARSRESSRSSYKTPVGDLVSFIYSWSKGHI